MAAALTLFSASALPSDRRSSPPPSAVDKTAAEPSSVEKLYRERAERNPGDAEAFEGMAILQVRRGDYADAIAAYRRVLELTPNNHDARVGLGRALALSGQFEAALPYFKGLLQQHPGDTDALEGLARMKLWAGHPESALILFEFLAERYPGNPEYAVGLARAEMNLHQYPKARTTLTTLLAAHPRNRDAQMQIAYLELFEGHQNQALRQFNHLVSADPTDREALQGNARIAYYRGDLAYAHSLTARLVDDDPRDISTLLLLARVERALHRTRQAWALIGRTEALDPGNVDARELEMSLRDDSRPTLHASASFAREVASGNASGAEDLSTFGYQNTWCFAALPRSESYFSLAYLPSQSPTGGIQGAVGPSQIFYHQTTYVTPYLTLRSGVGLVRFGPGELAGIPTQQQPITSAGTRPLGFGSISYVLSKKLTVDFGTARNAITYTPVAARLGVMEDRLSLGLDYRFNAKTDLRVEPFENEDSTAPYGHALNLAGSSPTIRNRSDSNRGAGASLTFNRKLFQRPALGVDLGYDGLAYGFSGGGLRPYLGFFNPTFYQRHYLTTHFAGKIHGPLGFDFASGAGVQQVERGTPPKLALLVSPALTLKASRRMTLSLGYTHYNSSQSLGTLRGDAVRLSTDWKF
jgi:tetratricopeptide (TPR) repeat protein